MKIASEVAESLSDADVGMNISGHIIIEQGEWEAGGGRHGQHMDTIFDFDGKQYRYRLSGSGDFESHFEYDEPNLDCPEVMKVETKSHEWQVVEAEVAAA